ncbi:MAG TPA: SDR family oxidoreductase [Desulfobacterales bacterium]|nr:SDR family oxidoreductase [Desulfobacterales bacterium]
MEKKRPVALITGAANNIGRACAHEFAKDYFVILADLQDASKVVDEIGDNAICVKGDVSDPKDCRAWVRTAEKFGSLKCLVHSAGITARATPIEKLPLVEWEAIIRVNLTGSFLIAQAAIPALRRTRCASILLISSRAGKTGFAALGVNLNASKAHYSASKAGVISLTKSLAVELASDKIRVNSIAPGPIEGTMLPKAQWVEISKRVPLGRLGKPEEIAAAAYFLCSSKAEFITGHILDVNGGALMD